MAEKSINFAILDRVLPQYQKISKAPDLAVLQDTADARKVSLEAVLAEEATRKYKSIASQTGDIFLIQNPAAWRLTVDAAGKRTRHRPKPQFVMNYKDALVKASENFSEVKNGWGI